MKKYQILLTILSWLSLEWNALGQQRLDELDAVTFSLQQLQPKLSYERAQSLAEVFLTVSNEPTCRIPWQILVGIAYIESSLGRTMINKKTHDYGLMQINRTNIERHKLSKTKLMTDHAYSVRFACQLLSENKTRYEQKYFYWLGIYRSGTALYRPEIRANAKQYDLIVRRAAAKLDDFHLTKVARVKSYE